MSSTEELKNERVNYSQALCETIASALMAMPYPDAYNKVMPIVVAGDPRLHLALKALKMDELADICKAEADMDKSLGQR